MKIKSLFIGMLASIALVGCTNNEELPLTDALADDMVNLEVAVNLEGTANSRLVSDGTGANTLMYAVFEKVSEGDVKLVIKKQTESNVTGLVGAGHNVSLSLLKGKTYQLVFWAQNYACEAYTVSDDMKLSIDYTKLTNNQESSDAFFGVKEVTVTSNTSVDVILKRPFAQVNVGVYKVDLDKAVEQRNLDVTRSKVTIKDVAKGLDLLTGNVTEEKDNVTFNFGDILTTESLVVDMDQNGSVEVYQWISMTYVLASSEYTAHDMVFQFTDKDESDFITVERVGEESPKIRRNYRTNIVGQVLFGLLNCNVVIDPQFEEMNRSGYIYYVFNKSTTISNQDFALVRYDESKQTWCVFTAPQGNTDENLIINFDNVNFSGHLYGVMFGEDWRDKNHNPITTTYKFNINKVTAKDVTIDNCISNWVYDVNDERFTIDHMSILMYLRGTTNVKNCNWTGTKTTNNIPIDYKGFKGEKGKAYDVNIAYDCGIPNQCKSTFEDSNIGSMYVWSQSKVNLINTEVHYIRNSAVTYANYGSLVLDGEKTVVNHLELSDINTKSFKPALTIKNGAKIKNLYLNGYPKDKLNIDYNAVENVHEGSCPLDDVL